MTGAWGDYSGLAALSGLLIAVVVPAALADRGGVGPDGVPGHEVEHARGHEVAGGLLVTARAPHDLDRGDERRRRQAADEDEAAVAPEQDATVGVRDDAVAGVHELVRVVRVPGGDERVHREVVGARELTGQRPE